MKIEPVTNEYAAERLKAALAAGDDAEVKKWDDCIRANNELRIRAKHRARAMKERALGLQLRHSSRLP